MFISKTARRYASALLQLAKERNEVDDILEDIDLIKNTIEDSDDLELFLGSPVIKYDDKREALEKIFSGRVNVATNKFISLLARKNRVNLLSQITEAFIQQYNDYAGIIEIEVYTAFELNETEKESLHESLEARTGKTVQMRMTQDESLKGGIAIRIDDTVIDGTVKHKLEELEDMFLTTAIE